MKFKSKSYRFLRLKKYNQRIIQRLKLNAAKDNGYLDTNHKWA